MAVQREGPACQPGEEFPDQEVFVGVGQEIQKGIVGGDLPLVILVEKIDSLQGAGEGLIDLPGRQAQGGGQVFPPGKTGAGQMGNEIVIHIILGFSQFFQQPFPARTGQVI